MCLKKSTGPLLWIIPHNLKWKVVSCPPLPCPANALHVIRRCLSSRVQAILPKSLRGQRRNLHFEKDDDNDQPRFLILSKQFSNWLSCRLTHKQIFIFRLPRLFRVITRSYDKSKPSFSTIDLGLKMLSAYLQSNYRVQLQCLWRAPGRRVTEKSTNRRSSRGLNSGHLRKHTAVPPTAPSTTISNWEM
jgi:hypothetical protein